MEIVSFGFRFLQSEPVFGSGYQPTRASPEQKHCLWLMRRKKKEEEDRFNGNETKKHELTLIKVDMMRFES